jgi:hypothetical protein
VFILIIMSAELKAKELYDKFQQYDWHKDDGWMPDNLETKKTVNKVIDEIEWQADNWGVVSERAFWLEVRRVLNGL